MAGLEQIKAAKLLGKRLRKVREEQGFNLAILAAKLKFTVVEIVAIEDGNLYAFDTHLKSFQGLPTFMRKKLALICQVNQVSQKKLEPLTKTSGTIQFHIF